MLVYHGSDHIIEKPVYHGSKRTNDPTSMNSKNSAKCPQGITTTLYSNQ